jgi:hypothetical protein
MNISFTITVYNELLELKQLKTLIEQIKEEQDEVVILHTYRDANEQEQALFKDIKQIAESFADRYTNFHFQNKFCDLKNYLIGLATKDYICNFDADELCTIDTFRLWKQAIMANNYDLYYLPRINTVVNYTLDDIKKYKWTINEYGWINWPDYQPRIFKNTRNIKWSGNVHEAITGAVNTAALPADPKFAIIHHKTIQKQRQQNNLYETIKR